MFQLNEKRSCCDCGAGTQENWRSGLETSDASMWASSTACARPHLAQFGWVFGHGEAAHTQSRRARRGAEGAERWSGDTKATSRLQLQLFKVSRSA